MLFWQIFQYLFSLSLTVNRLVKVIIDLYRVCYYLTNSSNTANSKSMHGDDSTYKLFRWMDANWPAFADFLNNVDWFDMLTVNHTSGSMWFEFTRNINEAVELFVSYKLVTHKSNHRPRGCVYPNYSKRELALKRYLWRSHLKSPHDYLIYIRLIVRQNLDADF